MRSIRLNSVSSEEEKGQTSYHGGFNASSLLMRSLKSTSGVRRTGVVYCTVPVSSKLQGIYSIKLSNNGRSFAAATGSGVLEVFSIDGEVMHRIEPISTDPQPMMYCKFHPLDIKMLYSCDNAGFIYVSNVAKQQMNIFAKEIKNEVHTFDIDCTSTDLISGGKDATLRIYDLKTAKLIHKYPRLSSKDTSTEKLDLHRNRIFKVKGHDRDGSVFMSGGWDNCVKIWDMRTPVGCQKNIPGPYVYGDAIDIRDRIMLTGSWKVSDSLQTWDIRTGGMIDTIVAINRKPSINGEFVYCAQFLNSDTTGEVVVSGTSGAEMLEVISIADKKVTASFEANDTIYTVDSYGDRLVFGGKEKQITIADYDTMS